MRDLVTKEEVEHILKNFVFKKIVKWEIEPASQELIGYLGEHLKLIIYVEDEDNNHSNIQVFVKCMPRNDDLKANYIRELNFFNKEYVTLKEIFQKFGGDEGPCKWRPKVLLLKEELLVFEDLNLQGYKMPEQFTMTLEEFKAVIKSMALFHAQSFVYEERINKTFNKKYSIWDDYKDILTEPIKGNGWRNAGLNAVIEYLKVYSQFKNKPDFSEKVQLILPKLYEKSVQMMKPSKKYRNVIVHRDLWTNNIFLKHNENSVHAIIIDYQTVLYCPPMMDFVSFVYFNTRQEFRKRHLRDMIEYYLSVMFQQLKEHDIHDPTITNKDMYFESYEDCLIFGMTQAAILIPIVAMDKATRKRLFCNPETYKKINDVSRSDEIIQVAKEDAKYRECVTELFDEIVQKYIKL